MDVSGLRQGHVVAVQGFKKLNLRYPHVMGYHHYFLRTHLALRRHDQVLQHAPLDVVFHLQEIELPRLLNVINLLITPTPAEPVDDGKKWVSTSKYEEDERHQVELSPLKTFGGLKLCCGKEWYRFPGHYLIPEGVQAEFVKREFDGMLLGHFAPSKEGAAEVLDFCADISTCDYLIDFDFPLRQSSSRLADLKPRYLADAETFYCQEFLDAANSGRFSRLLWFPGSFWRQHGFGFDGGNKFWE
ncbi:mannosyltransferase [Tulasnella sp. UAMH 9824]|nr:mannosyltransferase [Tulasnella sp. UAMH 9824]